ncbi:MAG: AmmeMemoRadiSam system protein B, partial [Elusimicrobia bacterium]|nr:AmmeMemoRadiSam system protein B [Elusimicrobiota bacterium]
MIRNALFAGTWYPKTKTEIEEYLDLKTQKTDAISCICPHAGWMYSGKVAGKVYSGINTAETYIIIGPNHTGNGAPVSIFSEGTWKMPLGDIEIDSDLSKSIMQFSEFLKTDTQAHLREHCIEVQIPFIQYFNPKAKIVPIILMSDEFEVAQDIANAVAESIKKTNCKTMIIASTDMTHYEPQQYAKKMDSLAIDKILQLDASGLYSTVK